MKYLEIFDFKYKNKKIIIKKEDNDYILNYGSKLDYNQLVEECNLIRSKRIIFNCIKSIWLYL